MAHQEKKEQSNWYNIIDSMGRPTNIYIIASNIKDAYKEILKEFQNIRIDKEIQYQYLKTIVEHVQIALFSFDESGRIEFINNI